MSSWVGGDGDASEKRIKHAKELVEKCNLPATGLEQFVEKFFDLDPSIVKYFGPRAQFHRFSAFASRMAPAGTSNILFFQAMQHGVQHTGFVQRTPPRLVDPLELRLLTRKDTASIRATVSAKTILRVAISSTLR
ncbi:MAG: hypothetical protein ABI589_10495 [Burkholderiales bacterium]